MDRKSVKQGNSGSLIVFWLFVFFFLPFRTIWHLNNTLSAFLLARGPPLSLSFCPPRETVWTPLNLFACCLMMN